MVFNTQERILVTGATGFVGSCLVRKLVQHYNHHKVSILVREKELNWRLKDIISFLDIHECDLLSPALPQVIDSIKPMVIFHLATYGALSAEDDVNRMIDINIKGTINLIKAVKKNTFKLFINTGSSSEYGIKDKKMKEDDVVYPINDYSVTKVAATLFCRKIAETESLPIINFRLFSPYGYFEERSRLIPSVIIDSFSGRTINVSSPYHVRDFIFIEDVVDAYIKACSYTFNPGDIFNVGSGKQHTIEDIVNCVIEITHSTSKVCWDIIKKQKRQIEPHMWEADITKIRRKTDWEPRYNLQDGLLKTVAWFRENKSFYV